MAPGDLVLFAKHTGTELRLGGEDHLILDANDVLAAIKTAAVAAA